MTASAVEQLAQAVLDGRVRILSTAIYERGEPVGAEHAVIVDDPYIPISERVERRA